MKFGVILRLELDMKKQELFDIVCNGRSIYKDLTEEELLDTLDDLSQEYYETGVPNPEDLMIECKSIED